MPFDLYPSSLFSKYLPPICDATYTHMHVPLHEELSIFHTGQAGGCPEEGLRREQWEDEVGIAGPHM